MSIPAAPIVQDLPSRADVEVLAIPAFQDNYLWLLRCAGQIVVVDPGAAEPLLSAIDRFGEPLSAIWITHHHEDHIGGIAPLRQRWPHATVFAPDDARIPHDQVVRPGMVLRPAGDWPSFHVLDLTGHTRSHVGYFGDGKLFCGDTLFSLGCGRLFEGSPEQMWQSLQRIATLPANTAIYCAHEYTQANLRFAQTVFPGDPELSAFAESLTRLRQSGLPSIPTVLSRELQLNPFLRVAQAYWRDELRTLPAWQAMPPGWSALEAFTALRRMKDQMS